MSDPHYALLALRLARRGRGATSPNPMVGAVLVKGGQVIGQGWHHQAGYAHAEIEALRDAASRGASARGATLYVTLEPCRTHGLTPPCTDAIIAAGIRRVVAGATDPNPRHAGTGFGLLREAGIQVTEGILGVACSQLNETFNHWVVHRRPFIMVKAAMTLDGKIATATGESKWITGERARAEGLKIRQRCDAILAGVNTILSDDPALTLRTPGMAKRPPLRRIVLDALARTPLTARVASDEFAAHTTIVVTSLALKKRVAALGAHARVLCAPLARTADGTGAPRIDLLWLMDRLGAENVTSLLVEGGGEVNASFLLGGLAQRIFFFYAPKILGGRNARKAVAGDGAKSLAQVIHLREVKWRRLGDDLMLTALVGRHQEP